MAQNSDRVSVSAAFTGTMFHYAPREVNEPFEYAEEDLAEMDPEDRAEIEAYDPEAEYQSEMDRIMDNVAAIKEQCDLLADALAAIDGFDALPEDAQRAFKILSDLIYKVTVEATPQMYASLPEQTKRLAEYADRLVQLYHLRAGSTYASPMDKVYSDEETARCVDDFMSGAEDGLARALSSPEKRYDIHIDRPDRVFAINDSSNLAYAIMDKAGASPAGQQGAWNSMFRSSVHSLTDGYRKPSDPTSP